MQTNNTVPRSKAVLRRLLLILLFTAGLVIFSYGWSVTDIDLTVPQEPQRQQNVGNALRELLSPNVFSQEYEVLTATSSFRMTCADDFAPPAAAPGDQQYIEIEPACGNAGDLVTVRGYNFAPNGLARMNWLATDGERRIRRVVGAEQDNFITDGQGSFTVQIEVPRIRGTAGETHTIEAQGRFPSGLPTISDTTVLVLEKMVETIFLALIATAVSILPSAVLSFFAAHNLMRPIRSQLGGLLVSFTLLPVGWVLGTLLLSHLGSAVLQIASGSGLAAAGSVTLFLGTAFSAQRLPEIERKLPSLHLRAALNALLFGVGAMLFVGLLGGLGLLFRSTFQDTILAPIATFIGSLGQLIELGLVPIAGLIGAFMLSSMGTSLSRDVLKQISVSFSHLLGAVLGALAGAILLALTASIGMVAAWLGLLTPFVAAGLAGSILPQIYSLASKNDSGVPQAVRGIRALLSWGGAIIGFVATFLLLNLRQSLIEGVLPPQNTAAVILDIPIYGYVLQSMLIGAVLGGISGALAGTKANFPVGSVLYNITRTLLNGMRSIEPLIMGLVFVIWVGIGPFAGVLALALHSVASLGKLYSEQIENIDAGPIEALQSTGANRLQTIMYAVVPQIIPPYIAFTMYRWDINVRMSTIIGFVGGGGIGFLLQQQINLLRYRDAGVAVLAIAIVVSVLDYASAAIRERYV